MKRFSYINIILALIICVAVFVNGIPAQNASNETLYSIVESSSNTTSVGAIRSRSLQELKSNKAIKEIDRELDFNKFAEQSINFGGYYFDTNFSSSQVKGVSMKPYPMVLVGEKLYRLYSVESDEEEFKYATSHSINISPELLKENCKKIIATADYACVLMNDGEIEALSNNIPSKVDNLANVTDMWMANEYSSNLGVSCAYIINKTLYWYRYGEKAVSSNCDNIIDVTVNENSLLYVTSNGEVYGIGVNFGHVLSPEKMNNEEYREPVQIDLPEKIRKVYAVHDGVYGVTETDKLIYWGFTNYDEAADTVRNYYDIEDALQIEKRLMKHPFNKLWTPSSKPLLVDENISEAVVEESGVAVYSTNKKTQYNLEIYESDGSYDTKVDKYTLKGAEKYYSRNFVVNAGELFFQPPSSKIKIDCSREDNLKYKNLWWTSYDFNEKTAHSSVPVLIDTKVKKISGNMYKKKKWYMDQIGKLNVANAKKIWVISDVGQLGREIGYIYWNRKNNIVSQRYVFWDMLQFFYKSRYKNHVSSEDDAYVSWGNKEISKVDDFWADNRGIAYVKNKSLYAFGCFALTNEVTQYRSPEEYAKNINTEDYRIYNKKLVRVKSIKTKNINNVSFGYDAMYATMNNGRVYKITVTKKGKAFVKKMRHKNVKEYNHRYFLKKNGKAQIFVGGKKYKVSGVKQIINNFTNIMVRKNPLQSQDGDDAQEKDCLGNVCFVLKKNGDLYGWGDNSCRTITADRVDEINFEDMRLIARNVKAISSVEFATNSIWFLKKNGNLYFKGYNGNPLSSDLNENN